MSAVKGGIYQRGPYWLDLVRNKNGEPASDRFYIFWHDQKRNRYERRSTRTNDVRVACSRLDEHYLATHRATDTEQEAYGVVQAMTDYWIEHGQNLPSADGIRARLGLFDRFRQLEQKEGRMPEPLMPEHIDEAMLKRLRKFGTDVDFIVARKKDEHGNWIDGQVRKRSASTVEESIIQIKAALNHAFANRRLKYVPPIKHKTRDEVTPRRTYRLSIEAIAELVQYSAEGAGTYAGHVERLIPLRRYLVGAICTLARPDAIMDMSVIPDREQWIKRERRYDLNYKGRIQTKKVRPVVPVVSLLHDWLQATDEWLVCGERVTIDPVTGEAVITQYRVASIRKSWDGAREHLGIPAGWGPKLLRHSMATILANRGVDLVQLEMALGHRVIGKTSSAYASFAPSYLDNVMAGIEDVISDLDRMTGRKLFTKSLQKETNIVALRA